MIPGFWQYETTGVLRPAIDALVLQSSPLAAEHIFALRAYLRQWINAPAWDQNPYATAADRQKLADLRRDIRFLIDRQTIEQWIEDAAIFGVDPI